MTQIARRINDPGNTFSQAFVAVDASAGPETVGLGDPSQYAGCLMEVMKTDSVSNNVFVVFNGLTIATLFTKGEHIVVYSNGSDWVVSQPVSAVLIRQVLDSFGHALAQFHAGGANAVNFIQLANAQTGADPEIDLEGSDTDIGLNIAPKGVGTVKVNGTPLAVHSGVEIGHTPGPGGPTAVEYNALVDALVASGVIDHA